jgi:hypothetical protein
MSNNKGGAARKKGERVRTTVRLDRRVYDMLMGDAVRFGMDFNSYVNDVLATHVGIAIEYPPTRVGVNHRSATQ